MINEHVDSIPVPQGLVTVDLINERGRVVQREQADNFISLQSKEAAKWWQRFMWGMFNPIETADANGTKPTEPVWFPAQHIAAWTDATAEDAATETGIRGDIVAWASRHPFASPTLKRGNVDISASEVTDAYAKWVFNWMGPQGNGTFQSVGWTRLNEYNQSPAGCYSPSRIINFTSAGQTFDGSTGLHWDATNSVWNILEYAGSSRLRLASVPASGGTTTEVCLLPASPSMPTGNVRAVGRLGTNILVAGVNISPGYYTLNCYTVAGALLWAVSPGISQCNDCTVDGSGFPWGLGQDGKMRKHDPTSGAILDTVTISISPYQVSYYLGIAYDPADGNFWVSTVYSSGSSRDIWKISPTGVNLGKIFNMGGGSGSASASPFAGNYTVPGSGFREPLFISPWRSSTQTGNDIGKTPSGFLPFPSFSGGNITMKGSEIWAGGMRGAATTGGAQCAVLVRTADGQGSPGSLGSRSRLSSPVTKDSSKVMKITYQLNFS